MQVSVIMATYNRRQLLPKLLERWTKTHAATKYEYELIFSDDGSDDDTVEYLKAYDTLPITVLQNQHGGAASARNAAVKVAKGEIFIFTGDDIYPELNFINAHYESYLEHGEKTATLGRIEWEPGTVCNHLMKHITEIGCEQFGFVGMTPYDYIDFRHFYTSNISAARTFFDQAPYVFDMRFTRYGFEDIELGYRMYQWGGRIFYNPDILSYHDHAYDSVDKFCTRQWNAGTQLKTFKDLHPELKEDEIKFDIDHFREKLHEYCCNGKLHPIDKFAILLIRLMRPATKMLEVILRQRESTRLMHLCSVLYRILFAYSFNLGYAVSLENDEKKCETFSVRHLLYASWQVFYASSNEFTEEASIKRKTYGEQNITATIDIPANSCKCIRFDPYESDCRMSLHEFRLVFSDGSEALAELAFSNARKQTDTVFDFKGVRDPILITKLYDTQIVKIKVSFRLRYFSLARVRRFIRDALEG